MIKAYKFWSLPRITGIMEVGTRNLSFDVVKLSYHKKEFALKSFYATPFISVINSSNLLSKTTSLKSITQMEGCRDNAPFHCNNSNYLKRGVNGLKDIVRYMMEP